MTVANFILTDHAVKIVTDTVCYCDKAPVDFARKVSTRPAARLAFVVRGYRCIAKAVADASEQWPGFEAAVAGTAALLPMFSPEVIGPGAEVTIAGWQDGPRVARLVRRPEGDAVERFDFAPGVYLTPSLGKLEIPPGVTERQIVAIAEMQQGISVSHGLNMCIGGDIEVTTVTEAGVETRVIGAYPDKAMMQRRIAAGRPTAGPAATERAVA